ncbi:serine hydrolase [Arthrobacter pityocampae]|uniref:serine hydrolase n=1 Tax=Arthrobacter pityocampae TaxID=547334 RepID=UPI00373563D3
MTEYITRNVYDDISFIAEDAGVEVSLHAAVVGRPDLPALSVNPHRITVAASLYKAVVMVAYCRMVDQGTIDPRERLTIRPGDQDGGRTGLSICLDPIELSIRDAVRSMMTVSDDVAGKYVLGRVGLEAVSRTTGMLGLPNTEVMESTDWAMSHQGRRALGTSNDQLQDQIDPMLMSRTTAADMVTLMDRIWTNKAASASQCTFMRDVLAQQVFRHRIASGFNYPGVKISAKTGSLAYYRHETAVVEHPAELPIAITVLTSSARRESALPASDLAVGKFAFASVTHLRQTL